jgi:antitoxin CptB
MPQQIDHMLAAQVFIERPKPRPDPFKGRYRREKGKQDLRAHDRNVFSMYEMAQQNRGFIVTADKRIERLRFRSWHRGTREMDLLLGSFADAHLAGFTAEELDRYEALLQQSDPDLYNWITGVETFPAEHDNNIARKLRAHRFANEKAV